MSSRENPRNIWTSNSAFLYFPSKKITDVNCKLLAGSALAQIRTSFHRTGTARNSKTSSQQQNPDCTATVQRAHGPGEIERDEREGNLMRQN